MKVRGLLAVLAASGLVLGAPSSALADDGEARATADALFAHGQRLMVAGDYANACRKFAASQRSTREVTTSLALANCYEKLGKTASAWAEYRSAIGAARAEGSPEAERAARDRAQALDSKLSYLTITALPGETVRVSRDGVEQDDAIWGTPIPVDPGRHVVEATAPGKTPWATAFDIGIGASQTSIDVPILAPARPSRPADPGRGSVSAATQRGAGIGVGVTGLLAATVGTIFALRASSRWDDAKSQCSTLPGACTARGVDLGNEAKRESDMATVALVVGGAAILGGAVLYLTAPRQAATEPRVALGLGPARLVLGGAF